MPSIATKNSMKCIAKHSNMSCGSIPCPIQKSRIKKSWTNWIICKSTFSYAVAWLLFVDVVWWNVESSERTRGIRRHHSQSFSFPHTHTLGLFVVLFLLKRAANLSQRNGRWRRIDAARIGSGVAHEFGRDRYARRRSRRTHSVTGSFPRSGHGRNSRFDS
jgi:hypothetical protein